MPRFSAVDLTRRSTRSSADSSTCSPVPRLEQRRRHGALGGDRLGRATAAASASTPSAIAGVVEVGRQRLVLVALERAVGDLDVAVDDRGLRPSPRWSRRQTACPARPRFSQQQRFELLQVDVGRLHLDGARRRFALHREGAVDRQRLIAARQPHVLQLDAPLTGTGWSPRSRARCATRPPASAPRAAGRWISWWSGWRITSPVASSSRCLFLDVGRELQALPLVGRLRRHRVELQRAGLDERRGGVGLDPDLLHVQIRQGHGVLAVEIERLVLAIADVAAVQRPCRLQRRGVARDRAVEHGAAVDACLPRQLAELREVDRLDVVLQVRSRTFDRGPPGPRPRPSRPDRSPAVVFRSATCAAYLPVDAGVVDGQAADRRLLQRDASFGGDRLRRDRRGDVGQLHVDVQRAA